MYKVVIGELTGIFVLVVWQILEGGRNAESTFRPTEQTLVPLLMVRWFQADVFDPECWDAAVTVTPRAWGGFYLEEYVGYNHRVVLYMDGFDRKDARLFYTGGTISTPKGDVMTTGSDVRLKKDFTESQEGASRRINALGYVSST